MEFEIIFYIIFVTLLGIATLSWPVFGRVSMGRIEKRIMADGLPRPCDWDGAGFRIILYVGALTIPKFMFNEHDEEPGKVNPKLVNKYAKTYDRVLAWVFLSTLIGFTGMGLAMAPLGLVE
ncbi:hypothetical protein [uncultured Marinobacter sp.]|uniref:hypothetical protein n=1 Tax=uncultured Marinobacter sp. TaxID=187379 RepID=UPI0030DBB2EF|tara:strand:- start:1296 stop:1658 length:363 start_codon:yes stop_codon:yes gene_type:complete